MIWFAHNEVPCNHHNLWTYVTLLSSFCFYFSFFFLFVNGLLYIDARDELYALEEAAFESDRLRRQERKQESKALVIQELSRELEMEKMKKAKVEAGLTINNELDIPDDTDHINEEQELHEWKLRELRRLKRDELEREEYEQQQAEIERRRLMTDQQIAEEDAEKLAKQQTEKKSSFKYLQRYYHKGAFYQGQSHQNIAFMRLEYLLQTAVVDHILHSFIW